MVYPTDTTNEIVTLSGLLRKYQPIGFGEDDPTHLGLVAQDVLPIAPGLVTYDPTDDRYGVRYSIINLKLLRAVGLLIERVRVLEDMMASL